MQQVLSAMIPILGAHNLGGFNFNLGTLMLLNRGLKFVATPPKLDSPTLQASVSRFERTVRLRCEFGGGTVPKFRVPNPGYTPPPAPYPVESFLSKFSTAVHSRFQSIVHSRSRARPNLSFAEREALKHFKHAPDMIIKPADKNLGLVVMRVPDYRDAVRVHVCDSNVYEEVADIEKAKEKACRELLTLANRYEAQMGKGAHDFVLLGLGMREVPHLYILPKLHKMKQMQAPIIGRPIAACHSWITTNLSIYVSDLLQGALARYDTILQDRTHLISLLENTEVTADTYLLTFDVESLYPCIDQVECVNACAEAVQGSSMARSMVGDFVWFILQNNIVQVEGKYHRQKSGGAMGTNFLPQAAQLYLAIKWEQPLKAKLGAAFPAVFKRFIDDGFVIFTGSLQELQAFVKALNDELPNINITHAYSQFQVDFMDLVIYKAGPPVAATRVLKVRTHQKVLNKYLYIPFSSFHHPGMFRSFLNAELIRYVVTNSDKVWYECMVSKFTHRLQQRGYPLHVISAAVAKVSYADRPKYLQQSPRHNNSGSVCAFVIPYVDGTADLRLPQLLHELYMEHPELQAYMPEKPLVSFKKSRNLGSWLVRAGA